MAMYRLLLSQSTTGQICVLCPTETLLHLWTCIALSLLALRRGQTCVAAQGDPDGNLLWSRPRGVGWTGWPGIKQADAREVLRRPYNIKLF